jgi:hypothetical protein
MPFRQLVAVDPYTTPKLQYFLASYGVNGWVYPMYTVTTMPVFWRESGVTQPSLTPLFADSLFFAVVPEAESTPSRDLYYDPRMISYSIGVDSMAWFTMARHGGGGTAHSSLPIARGPPLRPWMNNLVCYDDHVDGVKLDNLWEYNWHSRWEVPTTRPQ